MFYIGSDSWCHRRVITTQSVELFRFRSLGNTKTIGVGTSWKVCCDRPSHTIKVTHYTSTWRNVTPLTVIQGKYGVHFRLTILSDNFVFSLYVFFFDDVNVVARWIQVLRYPFSVCFSYKDSYIVKRILITIWPKSCITVIVMEMTYEACMWVT